MATTAHFFSQPDGAFSPGSRSRSKFRRHSNLHGISFAPGYHHRHAWWKSYDEALKYLAIIKAPVKFLSIEPLLEHIQI